ncbi:MAG: hypothetical protein ABR599_01325 [Gemmatimonadota bacterium]
MRTCRCVASVLLLLTAQLASAQERQVPAHPDTARITVSAPDV